MEAGATVDTVGVVLRMAQDEVRHAEACAEVVAALGGEVRVDAQGSIAQVAQHRGASPAERAMRNVIYGCCLTETINSARLVDWLDTTGDPFVRDVLRRLLSDEAHHGQFGYHYLEAWRPWLEEHAEARASITRYLTYAFAVLEKELSGKGTMPRELDEDERALGVPDPKRLPEVFYATLQGAIVPALERFGFEAGQAWAKRSFEPP
jgi:hypothetical protein